MNLSCLISEIVQESEESFFYFLFVFGGLSYVVGEKVGESDLKLV